MGIIKTVILFCLAGLAEIGGGWLIWQAVRAGRPVWWAILGGIVLIGYGIIPTLQEEVSFGRVYAAYGGIFVLLSLLWGWLVDGWQPDRFDILGGGVTLVGVSLIMWGRYWFG